MYAVHVLSFCRRITVVLLLGWLLAVHATQAGTAGTSQSVPTTLVMAAASDDPQELKAAMAPMAAYMQSRLAATGILRVDTVVVDDLNQLADLIRQGQADWVSETAYAAMLLEDRADAQILLRKWKQGVSDYRSVLFVRRDSPVQDLGDLQGRSIAFQHPGSTTGYFVPASLLSAAGLRVRPLASPGLKPDAGQVGFVFSADEYNTSMWVHKGLVDAGVLSNLDWQNPEYLPTEMAQDFRIIQTSTSIPRALELVRHNLDPGLRLALKQILLAAHEDPAAAEALSAYHGTLKFDELDGDAFATLNQLRGLLQGGKARETAAP